MGRDPLLLNCIWGPGTFLLELMPPWQNHQSSAPIYPTKDHSQYFIIFFFTLGTAHFELLRSFTASLVECWTWPILLQGRLRLRRCEISSSCCYRPPMRPWVPSLKLSKAGECAICKAGLNICFNSPFVFSWLTASLEKGMAQIRASDCQLQAFKTIS